MSSPGSLSWSLADSCSVVSFFTEFSSSTRPLFTTTDGGRRSSGWEKEEVISRRRNKREREPSKHRFISTSLVAFLEFMERIHPKGDKKYIKSQFLILVKKKKEKVGLKQWKRKKLRLIWSEREGQDRRYEGQKDILWCGTKPVKIKSGDGKGSSIAYQELWKSDTGLRNLNKRIRKDWERGRGVIREQCGRKRYEQTAEEKKEGIIQSWERYERIRMPFSHEGQTILQSPAAGNEVWTLTAEPLQQFGCVFSRRATDKTLQLTERHWSSHTVDYICTNSKKNMYSEQSIYVFVDFRDPEKEYKK